MNTCTHQRISMNYLFVEFILQEHKMVRQVPSSLPQLGLQLPCISWSVTEAASLVVDEMTEHEEPPFAISTEVLEFTNPHISFSGCKYS